jgi:hypothetical protein
VLIRCPTLANLLHLTHAVLLSTLPHPAPPRWRQVDYIDIPKRTMMSVPGYGEQLVEFGVLTSFAYPLEDGSGVWVAWRGGVPAAAQCALLACGAGQRMPCTCWCKSQASRPS